MNGPVIVEVYLLSFMRAADLVSSARDRLGLTSAAFDSHLNEAVRVGLDRPGHPMELYRELLGKPITESHAPDSDPYRRRSLSFTLALWPNALFTVRGAEDGVTGSVAFGGGPGVGAARPIASTVHPWELVTDQIATWRPLRVVDEWYPMTDYETRMLLGDGSWHPFVLRFDFGLLQEIEQL